MIEYAGLKPPVQHLITAALSLTRLHLRYTYGSADPKTGGLDCSGTVYYLLRQAGLPEVPRDSAGMYRWVWQESAFQAVVSREAATFELSRLQPGDLLFWTGTYAIERDPPVTHVMIYLGTERTSGRRVMVGASEGRTYAGIPRFGVSVFDFKISSAKRPTPRESEPGEGSRFIGYGAVPGLLALAPTPAPSAAETFSGPVARPN